MGRDGHQEVEVFDSREELDAFLAQDEAHNKEALNTFEEDACGRGHAYDDDGGFWEYRVLWHTSPMYETLEEAKQVLLTIARCVDPKFDSKVLVVGRVQAVRPEALTTLTQEAKVFADTMRDLVKTPTGEPNTVVHSAQGTFLQCTECLSILNVEHLPEAPQNGLCVVCDDRMPSPRVPFVASDEWRAAFPDGKYVDEYALTRKRSLFKPGYRDAVEESVKRVRVAVEDFRKRRVELTSQLEDQTQWVVAWSCTSAPR